MDEREGLPYLIRILFYGHLPLFHSSFVPSPTASPKSFRDTHSLQSRPIGTAHHLWFVNRCRALRCLEPKDSSLLSCFVSVSLSSPVYYLPPPSLTTHTHIHTHEPAQHSTQRTPIPPATGAHSGRQRHTRHPSSPLNTPITLRRIHSELDWKPNWISRRLSTSNLRSLDPGNHPLGSSSIQDPTLFHDVCVTGPRQFLDRISAPFRRPSRGQAW